MASCSRGRVGRKRLRPRRAVRASLFPRRAGRRRARVPHRLRCRAGARLRPVRGMEDVGVAPVRHDTVRSALGTVLARWPGGRRSSLTTSRRCACCTTRRVRRRLTASRTRMSEPRAPATMECPAVLRPASHRTHRDTASRKARRPARIAASAPQMARSHRQSVEWSRDQRQRRIGDVFDVTALHVLRSGRAEQVAARPCPLRVRGDRTDDAHVRQPRELAHGLVDRASAIGFAGNRKLRGDHEDAHWRPPAATPASRLSGYRPRPASYDFMGIFPRDARRVRNCPR